MKSIENAKGRGAADSYYRRPAEPHVLAGTLRVAVAEGSLEWLAYMAGYDENERLYNFKDWGRDPDDERMYASDDDYEDER